MKPRVEMRFENFVVVIMLRADRLRVCDDVTNPFEWADNYKKGTWENRCFVLARDNKAVVTQVHANGDKVRFYFRFQDGETAKSFCKQWEAICKE